VTAYYLYSHLVSQLWGRFADLWLKNHVYSLAWRMIAKNMEKAHAIMRIFEPFGQESAMCGNGIRCVADHLCNKWDLRKLRIIAEVTTPQPRIYDVEQCHRPHYYKIMMEGPKSLPLQFRGGRYNDLARAVGEYADVLDLTLPEAVADQVGSEMLRCYVTYTGEPHLVCFAASNRDVQNLLSLPPWIFHISAGEFCDAAQKPLLSVQQASCDRLFSSYG
jgi:diaminopimelate epimerase